MSERKYKMILETPSDLEIVLSRKFDAPRSLVFEVFTKPEHVEKWWGPTCAPVVSCEIDFRVGGNWRLVSRSLDGTEHPFKGTYLEIVRPERVVQTEMYDMEPFNKPEFEATVTVLFEEQGSTTQVSQTIKHQSKEGRDAHLNSGMESGAAEALDQLEDIVTQLAGAVR